MGLMKGLCLSMVTALMFAGAAWAEMAVLVSPGEGTAVSGRNCPTFSWSEANGALSYRIEVYVQMTADVTCRDAMQTKGKPVLSRTIAAPALSWTPSSGECLPDGMKYVWYMEGLDAQCQGRWSRGVRFQIEAAALSADQQEAVQEEVKGYLSGDALGGPDLKGAEISRIGLADSD